MQLFLRTLDGSTRTLEIGTVCTVSHLKDLIQTSELVPAHEQLLVSQGRLLVDCCTLSDSGISSHSTVHLLLRLCGGKGGFGALLRGQGRDGKITDNFDAMRDLSGRRVRHVEAEKKLKEWQADAKERELEKVAMQHMKEMAKQAKRQHNHEVNVEQVKEEQRKAAEAVQDAVQAALAAASASAATRKKPSSGSSSSSDEEAAADEGTTAGAAAAAGSKRKAAGPVGAEKKASPPKRAKPSMLAMLEGSDDEDSEGPSSDEE